MNAELSTADLALVEEARALIRRRYKPDWHVVAAALWTRGGAVFTGLHLEAHVGRIAVCAEAVALGRAATESGDTDIDTIVAVVHPGFGDPDPPIPVVSPCGMCREMISDYSPDATVIVPARDGTLLKTSIRDLLPHKYQHP